MANLRDRCPECTRRLVISRFDATFRLPDRTERLCFAVPGGLCEDCHQLYIDPELIEVLDLRRALRAYKPGDTVELTIIRDGGRTFYRSDEILAIKSKGSK